MNTKIVNISGLDDRGQRVMTRAKLVVCACGGETFLIYAVDGQDHPHLQCVACGRSYCQGGPCDAPK